MIDLGDVQGAYVEKATSGPNSGLGTNWAMSAKMAGGWAPEGGVQDQIEDNVADAVHKARRCLPVGNGRAECEDCGNQIPASRRTAPPGARTCVPCQQERDKRPAHSPLNRRGSKDSQLR